MKVVKICLGPFLPVNKTKLVTLINYLMYPFNDDNGKSTIKNFSLYITSKKQCWVILYSKILSLLFIPLLKRAITLLNILLKTR